MRLKSCFLSLMLCAAAALFSTGLNAYAAPEVLIKAGDPFPEIPLKPLVNAKDAGYLGIPEGTGFSVKDIRADLVLVEIMNVYCASCWRQLPVYNKLYDLIESNPETKGRIKMVAFGVGNKDWEVKYFREKFEVLFPVIPDPDFVMHEAIGGSKTPFSIFVRRHPDGKAPTVVSTHLGVIDNQDELLTEMQSMMIADVAAIREKGKTTEVTVVQVKAILTEEELQARVKSAFLKDGGDMTGFEKVTLEKSGPVYTAVVRAAAETKRLFANVISRPPPCDVCHDIHFIYLFDATGRILQFIPLQLTKYGNKDFDEADVTKMRERIVGTYVYNHFEFDARVDAVTRATITCAVIFKSLNEGQVLFKELTEKGLI